MARKHFAWLAVLLLATSHSMAAEFPYSVETAATRTTVRSGPGEAFYATSELPAGTTVEVYREAPHDWLAIRPTPDSFSYVRARHLEISPDRQTAKVVQAGVKTRVGSLFSAAHNVEYVALKQGERLHLLDGPLTIGSDGQAWYKIAPPSGEFRWIHRSQVNRVDTTPQRPAAMPDVEAIPLAEATPVTTPAASPSLPQPPTAAAPHRATTSSSRRLATNRASARAAEEPGTVGLEELTESPPSMATQPIPQPRAHREMTVATLPTTPTDDRSSMSNVPNQDDVQLTGHISLANRSTAAPPTDAVVSPVAATSDDASAWKAVDAPSTEPPTPPAPELADQQLGHIARLELELSRIVSQDIGRWRFGGLKAELEQLEQSASDMATREQARKLLDRTAEFIDLQRRHDALVSHQLSPVAARSVPTDQLPSAESSLARSQSSDLPPAPPREGSLTIASSQAVPRPPFAGQGWLVPVLTGRPDLPRFALTDQQGRIRRFVLPAPGLNLQRYVRKQVGIIGSPAANTSPTTRSAPLVAERVVVIRDQQR